MKKSNTVSHEQLYTINDIIGSESIKKRLNSLGIIKNSKIYIYTKAPLGDPVLVKINNSTIALRKKIFENIILTKDLGE